MLLHHSRRDARVDAARRAGAARGSGPLALARRTRSSEGVAGWRRAAGRDGPYALQAAIAAEHVADETDWTRVAALYGRLAALEPSPVVELNRAVAVAMARGPGGRARADRRLEGGPARGLPPAARRARRPAAPPRARRGGGAPPTGGRASSRPTRPSAPSSSAACASSAPDADGPCARQPRAVARRVAGAQVTLHRSRPCGVAERAPRARRARLAAERRPSRAYALVGRGQLASRGAAVARACRPRSRPPAATAQRSLQRT